MPTSYLAIKMYLLREDPKAIFILLLTMGQEVIVTAESMKLTNMTNKVATPIPMTHGIA